MKKPKIKKPDIPKEEIKRFLLAQDKMIDDMNERLNQRTNNE